MKRVNKFFKKHQNDDEKLLERSDLYSQFYLLCDQREKLVKQKVGHYALGIKLEKKNIARLKNDISGLNKKITKLEAELKLIADPSVLTAIEQEIKDSTKALDDLKKSLEGADPTNVAKIKKSIREQEDKIKDANDRASQLRQSLTSGPSYIEVYKTAVSKKEAEIKKCEDKIAHLNQNEVPLFKIRKDNKREIELMVNRVADVLDLTRYLYRKPAALSGGQRQRVALGRAIVRNPKVFLMDEPLSNLDAKLRVAMRSEITKIHERVGATTIYVTHDQTEAMTMADRVVCMKAGYVQQIGTPDDLYNNPSNVFVAGFIGSPAMNFIHCTVKKDTVVFKGDPSIAIKLNKVQSATLKPYEGKEIILGVRPEDMFTENDATNKRLTNSLKTHCDVSELLGNEIIIYTTIGQDKISMKVDAINNIKEGDTVMMKLNQDKLYFFDAKTEKRIYEVAATPEVKSVNKVKAKPTKKAKAKAIKPKAKKKTKK
ncbi:MAG: ATP-binding cassette domain-containing protein [Bacilli bacterium]|nr:ATP-binding cassette domain-containing protein [Bacilli bacterium]